MLKQSCVLLCVLHLLSSFATAQEADSKLKNSVREKLQAQIRLFDGRKVESTQAVPITIEAENCVKVVVGKSEAVTFKLPTKFHVDENQTTTRFRLLSSDGKRTYFGAIRHMPGDALAQLQHEKRRIKFVLDEGDLKDSLENTVTKFLLIPKQEPGKEWNGSFATLTMENVTLGQFKGVTKNTKDYAGMLAVLQIAAEGVVPGNQLPTFSKSRPSDSQPGIPEDQPR